MGLIAKVIDGVAIRLIPRLIHRHRRKATNMETLEYYLTTLVVPHLRCRPPALSGDWDSHKAADVIECLLGYRQPDDSLQLDINVFARNAASYFQLHNLNNVVHDGGGN